VVRKAARTQVQTYLSCAGVVVLEQAARDGE
jgi:hypothetical protein